MPPRACRRGCTNRDPLRAHLLARGIRSISPYRRGRVNGPFEDRRRLRVYNERWIIERTVIESVYLSLAFGLFGPSGA